MISFNEALNNYYEFKTLYETSYSKEKRDIINNKKLSWNEKRSSFQKLKPKCINCKRPVGTVFSRKFVTDNTGGHKMLLAVCGDRVTPCPLNINIKLDLVNSLENNIKELDNSIKEDKNVIIQKKNELLFGYITTERAVNIFDNYKTTLNETYELKNFFLELLISKTDNEENKNKLNDLLAEYYVIIKNIKQDIKDANIDNNLQLLEDTIRNNYVDLLMTRPASSGNPAQIGILEKIRNLKYMYNNVEYDEDTNEYHLVQKKNTIESLEEPYSSEVVDYVFGVFESKAKTKKKRDQSSIKSIKSKTRKLRVEDSTSEEKEKEKEKGEPTIAPDGTITWEDEEHSKVWNKLSEKHKEMLSKQPEWLQDSMSNYVTLNTQNKTLKLVFPKNIIFPPTLLDDGTYDFGNELYSEVNNKNPQLMATYLKDLSKIGKPILTVEGKSADFEPINKEKANEWFKSNFERKVYDFLYPVPSKLIVL